MGSWVARVMDFLSIFPRPSILDLGSGTGQTDGQRDDGNQRLMPLPIGVGHKKICGGHKIILYKRRPVCGGMSC